MTTANAATTDPNPTDHSSAAQVKSWTPIVLYLVTAIIAIVGWVYAAGGQDAVSAETLKSTTARVAALEIEVGVLKEKQTDIYINVGVIRQILERRPGGTTTNEP